MFVCKSAVRHLSLEEEQRLGIYKMYFKHKSARHVRRMFIVKFPNYIPSSRKAIHALTNKFEIRSARELKQAECCLFERKADIQHLLEVRFLVRPYRHKFASECRFSCPVHKMPRNRLPYIIMAL